MGGKRALTGIKPSGVPHLGNYLGMYKQTIALMERPEWDCYFFLADIHALNTVQEATLLRKYSYQAAATWLALGADPARVTLYRESDIPEITMLSALLGPATSKSLLNQAHAYKAIVAKNREAGKVDVDDGVSMGLFNYPLLMAADILAFDIDLVPVGQDQTQHVEIARDIARRFNVRYGDKLKLPQVVVEAAAAVIPGLDGRKMSKSYDNVIPLFQPAGDMEKCIKRIVTDTTPPEAPKDPESSTLFALYRAFATSEEIEEMRRRYSSGIGWGEVKKELFGAIQRTLEAPYTRYMQWMDDTKAIDAILDDGAIRARKTAKGVLERVFDAVGFSV